MSKRCLGCDRRAHPADVHCQRCGAAITPPPPAWLVPAGRVYWAMVAITVPFQLYQFGYAVMRTEQGRAMLATLTQLGRYVVANGSDIAGALFAFVVAPLVGLYFALRAMVDLGDWLDLQTQRWGAARFRKYGW